MRFPDPIPTGPLFANPNASRDAIRGRVREKAQALIAQARERYPEWTPPPFNPLVYAKHLGIEVRQTHQAKGWDALLVPRGEACYIIANAAVRSAGRRRFSLAHEVAHTFFDNAMATYQMRTSGQRMSPAARALERLCDEGAAELLMPVEWVRPRLAGSTEQPSVRAVLQLAADFRVSLEAAALRVTQVLDRPCAVGFFEYAHRPGVERLGLNDGHRADEPRRYRVRRVFHNSGVPLFFPRGKSLPRGSVVYRAATATGPVRGREVLRVGRSQWEFFIDAIAIEKKPTSPPVICAVMLAVN